MKIPVRIKRLNFLRIWPAFTQKGGQLSGENVTGTTRLANLCIHGEKEIRRLRVFKIL